jgi:hypothetical protein
MKRFKLEDRIFHHLWGLGTIKEIGDHLSVGEKITAREDKIILVEKIHEKLWRRYYSVKINGIEDTIKEHYAMFYKKTMQTRKIDSFSLESDIL